MEKINPVLVPQRKLFDGTRMPAIGMGTFGSVAAAAACSNSASVVVVITVTGNPRWVPSCPEPSAVRRPHAKASWRRWVFVRVSVAASTIDCSDSGR